MKVMESKIPTLTKERANKAKPFVLGALGVIGTLAAARLGGEIYIRTKYPHFFG